MIMTNTKTWTRPEADAFLRLVAPKLRACGFNCEIVGSVKTKGQSDKDLDILLTPIVADEFNFEPFLEEFEGGFSFSEEWGDIYGIYVGKKWVDFFFQKED